MHPSNFYIALLLSLLPPIRSHILRRVPKPRNTITSTFWLTETTTSTLQLPTDHTSKFLSLPYPPSDLLLPSTNPPKPAPTGSLSTNNPLDPDIKIKTNKKLTILNSVPPGGTEMPGAVESCEKWVQVRWGMTCKGIAEEVGVKVEDVLRWNKVGGSCQYMWADAYLCVGATDGTKGPKPTNGAVNPVEPEVSIDPITEGTPTTATTGAGTTDSGEVLTSSKTTVPPTTLPEVTITTTIGGSDPDETTVGRPKTKGKGKPLTSKYKPSSDPTTATKEKSTLTTKDGSAETASATPTGRPETNTDEDLLTVPVSQGPSSFASTTTTYPPTSYQPVFPTSSSKLLSSDSPESTPSPTSTEASEVLTTYIQTTLFTDTFTKSGIAWTTTAPFVLGTVTDVVSVSIVPDTQESTITTSVPLITESVDGGYEGVITTDVSKPTSKPSTLPEETQTSTTPSSTRTKTQFSTTTIDPEPTSTKPTAPTSNSITTSTNPDSDILEPPETPTTTLTSFDGTLATTPDFIPTTKKKTELMTMSITKNGTMVLTTVPFELEGTETVDLPTSTETETTGTVDLPMPTTKASDGSLTETDGSMSTEIPVSGTTEGEVTKTSSTEEVPTSTGEEGTKTSEKTSSTKVEPSTLGDGTVSTTEVEETKTESTTEVPTKTEEETMSSWIPTSTKDSTEPTVTEKYTATGTKSSSTTEADATTADESSKSLVPPSTKHKAPTTTDTPSSTKPTSSSFIKESSTAKDTSTPSTTQPAPETPAVGGTGPSIPVPELETPAAGGTGAGADAPGVSVVVDPPVQDKNLAGIPALKPPAIRPTSTSVSASASISSTPTVKGKEPVSTEKEDKPSVLKPKEPTSTTKEEDPKPKPTSSKLESASASPSVSKPITEAPNTVTSENSSATPDQPRNRPPETPNATAPPPSPSPSPTPTPTPKPSDTAAEKPTAQSKHPNPDNPNPSSEEDSTPTATAPTEALPSSKPPKQEKDSPPTQTTEEAEPSLLKSPALQKVKTGQAEGLAGDRNMAFRGEAPVG